MSAIRSVEVITTPVTVLSQAQALTMTAEWAGQRRSSYVCAVNVHSVMEATRDGELASALRGADMNVPDGVPIVWAVRMMGAPGQLRLFGPTVMWEACRQAAVERIAIALYGSTPETLDRLRTNLRSAFPMLVVSYAFAPPFRPLTQDEDEEIVGEINGCGAGYLFVGLGAPKQEKWMAAHRGRLNAVMFGVGAGFDYHAGNLRRAPVWMQRAGLEWFYRLVQEPRRLWRRYLVNNPAYVVRAGAQILRYRLQQGEGAEV